MLYLYEISLRLLLDFHGFLQNLGSYIYDNYSYRYKIYCRYSNISAITRWTTLWNWRAHGWSIPTLQSARSSPPRYSAERMVGPYDSPVSKKCLPLVHNMDSTESMVGGRHFLGLVWDQRNVNLWWKGSPSLSPVYLYILRLRD